MSSSQAGLEVASSPSRASTLDMKLEVVVIPVTSVERAKRFYGGLGWRLDGDFVIGNEFRGVQFTPPGSPCSIQFSKGGMSAEPGAPGITYLVVADLEAARAALLQRGIDVGAVFHRAGPGAPAREGLHPERRSYASFASFKDPDENVWLLQEVTTRLPGRVNPEEVTFTSVQGLAEALRRAEAAHGEHETETGARDADWPRWYAQYLVREQAVRSPPT